MSKRQENAQGPAEYRSGPFTLGPDLLGLATLIGVVALLMISFANWRDIDRIDESLTDRLGNLETKVTQLAEKMDRQPAQAAPPPRGPDPNRVYSVRTVGAAIRGPESAPIVIAEFSDFQ